MLVGKNYFPFFFFFVVSIKLPFLLLAPYVWFQDSDELSLFLPSVLKYILHSVFIKAG